MVTQIHAEVLKKNLIPKDTYIATALLSCYAKCGALNKARQVFEQLPARNAVPWNALISGYAQHGLGHEALQCFGQMQDEGVSPDAFTYSCILKACGIVGALDIGEDIDAEVRMQGLLEKDTVLGNALVDMYGKCGSLRKAREVFEQLPMRDVISWTTLMTSYARSGLGDETLKCFRQMQDEGISPNAITYICVLKACGIVGSIEIGEDIDAEIKRQGLLRKDLTLGNALVDMYAKCGALEKAKEVFDRLPCPNVVSWNILIVGYAQHGFVDEALRCFKKMPMSPDAITYLCILKACSMTRSLQIGEYIDAEVRKRGLLENDIMLGNTLVDMYSKCGALEKAQEVFEQLPVRNVVSWNALMTGYAEHGLGDDALEYYKCMLEDKVSPDAVTYSCILKVCGIVGALTIGEDIDAEVRKQGLLQKDIVLGNVLVDMYAKCGALERAQEVFKLLPGRNVVSWTAVMAGFAQLGEPALVLRLLMKMLSEGIVPDSVTFLVLLSVCNHAGLLKEGAQVFDDMCVVYGLTPTLEHYTCVTDLFVRAGHFAKANYFLEKTSTSDNLPLFLTILGACHKWVNMKLGRWAFQQSVMLDENCTSAYVCMTNMYAAADMHADEIEG